MILIINKALFQTQVELDEDVANKNKMMRGLAGIIQTDHLLFSCFHEANEKVRNSRENDRISHDFI